MDTSKGTGRETRGMGKYWGPLNFQDGVLDEWGASKFLKLHFQAGLDSGWCGPGSGKVILYFLKKGKREVRSHNTRQPRAPGRQRLLQRKGWCLLCCPLAPAERLFSSLSPSVSWPLYTADTRSRSNSESPNRQHRLLSTSSPDWVNEGADLQGVRQRASCPDGKPGPRLLTGYPQTLTTMTP